MKDLTKNVKGLGELTLDGLDLMQKVDADNVSGGRVLCEKMMKKIQEIQDNLAKIHAELADADEAKCNRIIE